jgi:bacillithiol biosynthesis cysteine-adding enzyme BshC
VAIIIPDLSLNWIRVVQSFFVSTDATLAAGLVRDTIPYSRLPWIRPLVDAYVNRFASVASLVPGNPADPAAWRTIADQLRARGLDRRPLVSILHDQQARRGAPAAARDAARRLLEPGTVAIVTGQQAGVFGGPLYTLLKAVSTIALARYVESTAGIAAVPVFWVDAEDHDWDEICGANVLDRDLSPASVTVPTMAGCGHLPVGRLTFDSRLTGAVADLFARLPDTEHTGWLRHAIDHRYTPGASVTTAFAGLLDDLLGAHGLVVFEPDDVRAKPLVSHLFVRELSEPGLAASCARDGARRLQALGHAPQIEPADDVVSLFYLDENGRHAIRKRATGLVVGEDARQQADLVAMARRAPESFSPNVLLRPLVQDCLFPTACYVGGPSELAYQTQLGGAYTAFGLVAPLLAPRVSATLLDSAAVRFLKKQGLPLEALQPQDELALNRLLAAQLPPELDATFAELEAAVSERSAAIKAVAVRVDPTLGGAVDTTIDRLRDTLKTLHGKVVQGAKKKDETVHRQFIRARTLAFPSGHPQERELNATFFLNRYGPELVTRLLEAVPPLPAAHLVIVP